MAYLVKLMPRARRDLASIFNYIHASESDAALRWYSGLKEAILTLEEHPYRCALTPESNRLRHLLYGNKPRVYRVIYRILESDGVVEILHIRHGARRAVRPRDLR
jgi:toxin ParE1/3/4